MVVYLFIIWFFLFIYGNLIPVGSNYCLMVFGIQEVHVLSGITDLVKDLAHAK